MSEANGTPTTPNEGTPSSEAVETTLLTSAEPSTTTEPVVETQGETAKTEEAKTEETKVEGAPEKYDFKAPEGKTYDPAVLDTFSTAAKEANLTQEAAQKLIDNMGPALVARQAEQVKAVTDKWQADTIADPEFGGAKLQENLAVAKLAYDAYATPELKTLLETTKLGNHPEVVRLMFKVGQTMKQDGFVAGAEKPGTAKTAAEILYDNTPK